MSCDLKVNCSKMRPWQTSPLKKRELDFATALPCENPSFQLTDRTNAQTQTVKPYIRYPRANEDPTGADVIRDHSCQRKPHRPETVSSQLVDAADTAQPVIWHDFLHHREPENLVDGQAKVDDHHRHASYHRLNCVREGQAKQNESHAYANHHQVHGNPAPAQTIQIPR